MPASCGESKLYPAKRRRVLPRQAPPITSGTASESGTSSTQATGISSGAVSEAASTGATTSSPAGPTGRQNPGDTSSDGTGSPSGTNTSTGNTTSPSTSPSTTTDGTTSQPTSQPTTSPTTTEPTTTTQTSSSTTTTTTTTSEPTTSPTSTTDTSQTTTSTTTTTSTSTSSSDTTSQSSSTSSQSSAPPTLPLITNPTSLSPTPSQSETPPPSSDTGTFATTITSAVSTVVVNGTTSTIFTQIPTTLSSENNSASQAATKRNIIAGTVGGAAFIILITALFLFYRRHQTKKVSFFKRLQPKPRTRLLDGEDMDDFDLGTPMVRYTDYPVSVASTAHTHSRSLTNPSPSPHPGASPLSREFQAASPGPSVMGAPMDPHRAATPSQPPGLPTNPSPPHLLGMRSESGSIFREAVWPPPGENSSLIDPLRAASAVDLSRIIDDVMGPTAQRGPPPSYARRDARASGSGSGTADLVGDDPFATLTHSREASDAPLLPKHQHQHTSDVPQAPGSPMPAPKFGALFVTNMGPLSPSSTITSPTLAQQQALGGGQGAAASPTATAGQPRNWLQRSPKKPSRPSIDEENAVDVTDVTSTGHGVGEAL